MKQIIRMFSLLTLICFSLSANFALAGKGGKSTPAPTDSCAVEPIVMVHGFLGSTSNFDSMESRLQADQPACALYKFGYNSVGDSNKISAARLSSFVDGALSSTGQAKARLIAHSNGGLVSRWYDVFENGSKKTSKLITMGTPHNGTSWAYGCFSPACFEMRPNSSFLQSLAGKGCDISLWSDTDEIILPNSSAQCGTSIQIKNSSHNGMLSDADVFIDVKNNL